MLVIWFLTESVVAVAANYPLKPELSVRSATDISVYHTWPNSKSRMADVRVSYGYICLNVLKPLRPADSTFFLTGRRH
jgi:hypothetical protein